MESKSQTPLSPKELLSELQVLAAEAKAMIGSSLSDYSTDALDKLRVRFDATHDRFSEVYADAREKVIAGAKCSDTVIRANPYQSIAIALGVGLLIGVLAARSRD